MKPILIYDTETTGLPLFKEPSEHPGQPYITQIAAELVDEESGDVLGAMNCLIRPEGWVIPPDLEKLTGITNEKARGAGVEIDDALTLFVSLWECADLRVGHNEPFDARMMRIMLLRNGRFAPTPPEHWKIGAAFCTMAASTSIVNLPPSEKMMAAGRYTPKSPNLGEAYKFFTGNDLVGAHNAMVDVTACKKIYFALKAREQKS